MDVVVLLVPPHQIKIGLCVLRLRHDLKQAQLRILARGLADQVAQGDWCCVHPAGGEDPLSTTSSGGSLIVAPVQCKVVWTDFRINDPAIYGLS